MDIVKSRNNDRNNPLFYEHVIPRLKTFFYHIITNNEREVVLKIVLKHFNLQNKYQLKDMYEGEVFYLNLIRSYGGLKTIYKYTNCTFNVNNMKLNDVISDTFLINNNKFRIINFEFGTIPKIEKINLNEFYGVILCLHRDTNVFICGSMRAIEFNKIKTFYFEKFDELKPLNDFI